MSAGQRVGLQRSQLGSMFPTVFTPPAVEEVFKRPLRGSSMWLIDTRLIQPEKCSLFKGAMGFVSEPPPMLMSVCGGWAKGVTGWFPHGSDLGGTA